MRQFLRVVTLFLVVITSCFAQKKSLTLEEIWGGAFQQSYLASLNSMNNGSQYTVLNNNYATSTTSIDVYSYDAEAKVKTLLDSRDLAEIPFFDGYEFSADEKKLLLTTASQKIYRHSVRGIYYVYDLTTKELTKVSDELIQEPTFSPDGTKIAYVYGNNLYVKDLTNNQEQQITTDGKKNEIINGITDWVYEEEFGFVRAFDWNSDGTQLAYIRFDERQVPEFSMDVYGVNLYPYSEVFKYPKAGEKNAEVQLFTYHLASKKTTEVSLATYNDFYIPRIQWTKQTNVLSAQVLNRHQNKLDLLFIDASTANTITKVLEEKDDAYITITDSLTFLDDDSFLWTSEKDGYNHIYHYDKTGKLINQVTQGDWEITDYYGYNAKTKTVFYQSVESGSVNRDIYAVKINGKNKKRLSQEEGIHNGEFSADFSLYIDNFSNATTPARYTLHDTKSGAVIREIKNSKDLAQKLTAYKPLQPKEFSTIAVNGETLNMWMIKPANFDPKKKYPLFMYQYSGPGSQMVKNAWHSSNDLWYQMLVEKGYIVACVDGRGTGMKGAKFKKVTQNDLGKYEVEDQITAARLLGERSYIDAARIGIWGWSYGGFMSSNCLFKAPETFKMAIAVAPVTSWRFYDTIYTERYLKTPQENPAGYDKNSPINYVDHLEGKFLLVHGSADDNVHVQNTMQMVEALVQANKQFDWAIYPDKNHGIYGGNTRLHLYTKMTNFIQENL